MAADEFDIIRRHFNRSALAFATPTIVLGIGDDCALLAPTPDTELAVSMDMLQEGVHFLPQTDPFLLGQRTLLVNLSDLAAMGAKPVCFTLALSLPAVDEFWLEQFSAGLAIVAGLHNCPLVGGDMISSQAGNAVISLCVQVHGELPVGKAIRRSGARPGDLIYVSGTLGDAAAGLQILQQVSQAEHPRTAEQQILLDAFFQPESRVNLGLALRDIATASIDVSDGLASDLGHVLLASGVAAVIDLESLPLSNAFCALIPASQRLALALGGGDDYELCFTVAPAQRDDLERCLLALAVPVVCIGVIAAGNGIRWQRRGSDVALDVSGYNHFATA